MFQTIMPPFGPFLPGITVCWSVGSFFSGSANFTPPPVCGCVVDGAGGEPAPPCGAGARNGDAVGVGGAWLAAADASACGNAPVVGVD